MPTVEKEREVELLGERFKNSSAMVFTDFRGLTAQEMVELRQLFSKNDLEYRVIKNTLARLAAKRVGYPIEELLEGPTGICFGYDDPSLPFKLATECAKRYKQYEIRGGFIEGEMVKAAEVEWIAKLPSREELIRKLAHLFQGPIQKLAFDLKGIINSLATVLKEVQKQKEER